MYFCDIMIIHKQYLIHITAKLWFLLLWKEIYGILREVFGKLLDSRDKVIKKSNEGRVILFILSS